MNTTQRHIQGLFCAFLLGVGGIFFGVILLFDFLEEIEMYNNKYMSVYWGLSITIIAGISYLFYHKKTRDESFILWKIARNYLFAVDGAIIILGVLILAGNTFSHPWSLHFVKK